jgi:hypothetical protein
LKSEKQPQILHYVQDDSAVRGEISARTGMVLLRLIRRGFIPAETKNRWCWVHKHQAPHLAKIPVCRSAAIPAFDSFHIAWRRLYFL